MININPLLFILEGKIDIYKRILKGEKFTPAQLKAAGIDYAKFLRNMRHQRFKNIQAVAKGMGRKVKVIPIKNARYSQTLTTPDQIKSLLPTMSKTDPIAARYMKSALSRGEDIMLVPRKVGATGIKRGILTGVKDRTVTGIDSLHSATSIMGHEADEYRQLANVIRTTKGSRKPDIQAYLVNQGTTGGAHMPGVLKREETRDNLIRGLSGGRHKNTFKRTYMEKTANDISPSKAFDVSGKPIKWETDERGRKVAKHYLKNAAIGLAATGGVVGAGAYGVNKMLQKNGNPNQQV